MKTTKTPSASSVSRALHTAGFRPLSPETSRTREGIRVTRSGDGVSISADFDGVSFAARMADDIIEALTEMGYTVERNPHSPSIVRVS